MTVDLGRVLVMLHFDQGGDNAQSCTFFDHMFYGGVPFDVIGLSYYPFWHGPLSATRTNVDDLATRYHRPIELAESQYAWTLANGDSLGNSVWQASQIDPGYPATPGGQYAGMRWNTLLSDEHAGRLLEHLEIGRRTRVLCIGRVLFGDGNWESPPTEPAPELFGDDVLPEAELHRLIVAAAWRVLSRTGQRLRFWPSGPGPTPRCTCRVTLRQVTHWGSVERRDVRRCSIFAFRWVSAAALVAALGLAATCATAASARVVRFHGYRLAVPAGWPVYQLARRPRTCVRFDRHAVYLGTPGSAQTCPAHAVGRTESVLVSPVRRAGDARAAAGVNGAAGLAGSGGSVDRVTLGASGLVATATWSSDRRLVARMLRHRLAAMRPTRRPAAARPAGVPAAHAAGAVFTGLGFDACSTPSASAMSAWSQSPFRAVGVYIGGLNSSCAQPNLTPGWVTGEVAAGWHLIPTYVGYQGAGACGSSCATINPTQATAEGTAAASDAVSSAQALGIPGGNPIYDDMEQYSRSTANTAAVLAFLSGWTTQLHAAGYQSGVYSSASSAITDLVNQQGTGYQEPDDIWIGDWNNQQSTSDPYVPAGDWSSHVRVHQYEGAHNDTYGGVTLNVDSDYLDGATADTGGATTATPVVPDGTFVQEAGSTDVYRVAGKAPLLVTSWTPYGGPQPVTTLSAEQFAQLAAYPADGTFVQTTTELNYRFAGGAPFAVSSWSVFGGIQPYVVVDEWNIQNAGNPLSHVDVTPVDGTVVQGLPSNSDWAFCSGQRSPVPANAKAVEVDDAGLAAFAQGTNSSCVTVRGAGALQGKVVKRCVVPHLKHMTLTRARGALLKANCRVGKVRKPKQVKRHHTLRVYGQSAKVRSQHAVRYRVNLLMI